MAAHRLSLVVVSGASLQLWCEGLSLWWLLLLWRMGSRVLGLQWLQHVGLVTLRHVGSSLSRDQTHVPCIGRWILNHWTTKETRDRFKYVYVGFPCKHLPN